MKLCKMNELFFTNCLPTFQKTRVLKNVHPRYIREFARTLHVAILFCKGKKITCLFSENNDLSKKRLKKGNTNFHLEKQPPDILQKRVFLKISQNSQENACVGVSF